MQLAPPEQILAKRQKKVEYEANYVWWGGGGGRVVHCENGPELGIIL